MKNWVAIGALSAALAVVCGAFGAHGLKERVSPEDLAIWQTGVLYHLIHAPALVLYGMFSRGGKQAAGWCFLAGTAIFSGTLYGMTLGGPRWLGAITPIGGVLLIAGWLAFAWEARGRAASSP
ncbi:MAG: DUF423 domain-containing protein [Planctomycetota bacterium]|nr:DUF423 domain-containing protein [Planctomycetota bacterium]